MFLNLQFNLISAHCYFFICLFICISVMFHWVRAAFWWHHPASSRSRILNRKPYWPDDYSKDLDINRIHEFGTNLGHVSFCKQNIMQISSALFHQSASSTRPCIQTTLLPSADVSLTISWPLTRGDGVNILPHAC